MSKLEELIQKYCPEGVEYIKLGDIEDMGYVKLGRGNVISKQDMKDCPGDFPVYSSSSVGDGEIGRYGKYMFDDERISWSIDGGGKFFYRNNLRYSITNVSGWLKVLAPKRVSTKYLYYSLMNEWIKKVYDYTHKAHPSVIREEYIIPIPPLPVQEEIVRVLDTFTDLQEQLQAELQKRQQQYSFYRDLLLTNLKDYKEYCISDIACFRRGSFPQPYTNIEFYGGKESMPFVQVADIANEGFLLNETTNQTISKIAQPKSVFVPQGTVICSLQGSIGRVAITQYDAYVDRTIAIFTSIDTKLDKRYFAFQLSRIFGIAKEKARGGTIKTITKEEFSAFTIKVPSLSEQQRIVAVLGRFDTLTTSISKGLPAEITARKKQYEYYRDTLLSFRRRNH